MCVHVELVQHFRFRHGGLHGRTSAAEDYHSQELSAGQTEGEGHGGRLQPRALSRDVGGGEVTLDSCDPLRAVPGGDTDF